MGCAPLTRSRPMWIYYIALAFVVCFWGVSSVLYTYLYRYYSASALCTLMTFFCALFFLILTRKKWRLFDRRYLRIALPICGLNALACMLQRIGLQYTTPAKYAFLEHLCCVVVPIMMLVFTKKCPARAQWCASLLCLTGCFILSGVSFSGGGSISLGDALCATAGILFGVCVAAVGTFTKGMDATLYMLVHTGTYFVVSLATTLLLDRVTVGGVPMEEAIFTFEWRALAPAILIGLVDIALCWLLKTVVTRHIDPTTTAVVGPFSAVITGVVSVLAGMDTPSPNLLIGGSLIFIAAILPDTLAALRRLQRKP